MGCQKDITAKIISKKADYILAVKDNQPTLRFDALLMSKHCRPDDDFIDTDAGHGHVEQRRTRIYRDMAYVSQFWPGVSAVIRVDPLRYDKSNDEYKALETRFYITYLHHVEDLNLRDGIVLIGGLKTNYTGCWIWPSMKMPARRGRGIQRRLSRVCCALHEIFSNDTKILILLSYPIVL